MKVLFVGVYRDGGGYCQAARDYVLALDAAGVDVVCRPLKLNDAQEPLPERIRELEAKSSRGCDVFICHTLPHQADYNGRFRKNIALYASETSNFRMTSWADRLNAMSEAWVINRQMMDAARASGVTVPLRVVPHATDTARFERSYEPLDALKPYRDRGDFLFYFVGEMVRRKNLQGLLKAFHTEFDPDEPVQLVIKTNKSGMSAQELRRHVEEFCVRTKAGLKMHGGVDGYKREILILDRLTDHGMMRLHASCDCFVMPSYGEAWNLPTADAMAMGKTPIVSANTGFLDYMSDKTGWMIPCHEEPVFGVGESFSDLYTGHETWQVPDMMRLRAAMREAFEGRGREEKAVCGIERAFDFSYESVGRHMRCLLDED